MKSPLRALALHGPVSRLVFCLLLCALAVPGHGQEGDDKPAKRSKSDVAQALDELNEALKDIHSKAIKARDAKDFSQVEKLRLERLQILQASRAESPWTAGYQAIMEAD